MSNSLERLTDSRLTKRLLRRASPATAASEFSIYDDRWDSPDSEFTRTACNRSISHIQHLNVARRAGQSLNERHRFFADAAPGAEDLYHSSLCHDSSPLY